MENIAEYYPFDVWYIPDVQMFLYLNNLEQSYVDVCVM